MARPIALALTLLGAAILAVGVALVYFPGAVILVGAALLGAGLFGIDV